MKTALINDFMSLIYPRTCEACEALLYKHEEMVCNSCLTSLPKANFHQNENNQVLQMLGGRVPLTNAACLYVFEKGGRVQRLLHAIKYDGKQNLAILLGNFMGEELKNNTCYSEADLIVPIPLHKNKLKSRGFNQSELFAKGLGESLGIKTNTTNIYRNIETATQTRKRKYERWENVEGVFKIIDPAVFKNKKIVLVDDVITTGATIEAAWLALKEIEGLSVSLATIAFAEK